ncbi:MAG: heme A synthase [Bacteroidetes bacterium]|jgi:heme a synthase|nr:MAG: heme A synthase [Bacteroidota bacterium]TAE72480.1 MAG: heme A synthase [Bacteroidota bacterium]TAF93500.1 MAG: heme A synthase [Bacteroidota bacterium]
MQGYIKYTWFVLIFVFVVILAGGLVRMTQSGMGCPDWPTCFGKWIPPTSADQLPPDFEKYLRQQDIDHTFNVYHTWIEYLNRLAGALLGLFILIHVGYTLKLFWKTNKTVVAWSVGLLLLTGFQGWLGKKVVDHNLAVVKITIHMLVALVIAAIPLIILHIVKPATARVNKVLLWLTNAAILLVIAQIVIGTDVREQIDEISKAYHYEHREAWIAPLNNLFVVHKISAFAVTGLCIYLFFQLLAVPGMAKQAFLLLATLLGAMAMGLIMAYIQMPAFAQPSHLLLSSILIIVLLSIRLHLQPRL